MPQWQGKSRGTTLGYRIFVFVCRHLGIFPAYFILRFVAGYYFLFSWTSSGHIYRYFRRLGIGRVSAFFRIYRNYYVFGQTLLDKVMVMAGIDRDTFTYDFDGEDNLRAIVAQGKGGILLSAHVGNWEAAGHLLRRLETRVNVVMYDGEHQQIKQYLESVTGGHNFRVIIIGEDMSHVYAIGEALQKNELVCLHADRFLEGNKTMGLPFLSGEALFPLGPFQLAAGFRVPVSLVFAFKESARHYHFFGSPLYQRGGEPKEEFTDRLMRAFVGDVEQKLKRYPEQWFNYYNFWYK